ncbi:MAG: hypothetical protein JRH18_10125 [Deltaproteobacteria bacterium]|nr:hypothetical protein [Deltaproteobacteria bacterium]MBW1960168.1 hypothetical protein [Deltaproteobacteria bacterium]MBW2152011.1 hypothetical protein [Deltaproteobacteria bacterium]
MLQLVVLILFYGPYSRINPAPQLDIIANISPYSLKVVITRIDLGKLG